MYIEKEVQKIDAATKTIQKYLPRLSAPKLVRDFFVHVGIITLIVTPLMIFASNVFFNFYYAIPEVPKYVKVFGYQTSLKVSNLIPQQLEEDYIKKLAIINPDGLNKGVLVNNIEGRLDSMIVNGSLIATSINEKIGMVNAKPLQFESSYKKGMRSSYLVGNKYYDIDLKVNGTKKGLIANNSGYEKVDEMTLFTASIGLIKQADQALRIDLESFLNQSSDREYSLRTYLIYLNNVEESIKNTQVKVDSEIVRLSNEESATQAKMDQTESDFFAALNKFDQNESYKTLDQFILDYQDEVDKKAHLQAMNQIDKYFDGYLPLLTAQIEAVETNRNALVHGITVVAFQDVDLGLISIAN